MSYEAVSDEFHYASVLKTKIHFDIQSTALTLRKLLRSSKKMRSTLTVQLGLAAFIGTVSAFDAREATISSVHHDLYAGLSSCREVVSAFVARIEAFNSHTNAIISLNPQALVVADEYDASLASRNGTGTFGPLFCVPVLLKDNYDTFEMPTTGASLALANSQPSVDATSVTALKRAGAVILGKASLYELALEGLSVSSFGGQVINPYDHTRTAGGSSGGTGAAIAASFAVWGTGTDTVNSLRSPASANSLVSIRPTRGLVSRTGIIPISYTQDVGGPIGRCIEDIAVALSVMASVGYDADDNTTALVPPEARGVNYASDLTSGSLSGMKFGLLEGFVNRTASNETTPVNDAMADTIAKLRGAGATIIPITDSLYNATALSAELDNQRYEYRELLSAYLQRPSLGGEHPSSTKELYGGDDYLVIPSQYEYVNTALVSSTSNTTTDDSPSYASVLVGIQNLTLALQNTFAANNLDAIIYPEQKNLVVPVGAPSQSGRNGILAALTSTPVVTVPIGFSPVTKTAPEGIPIGMEILGRPWSEGPLLKIGYQVEGLLRMRRSPRWALQEAEVRVYDAVPSITPDSGNIPAAYPLGTLGV